MGGAGCRAASYLSLESNLAGQSRLVSDGYHGRAASSIFVLKPAKLWGFWCSAVEFVSGHPKRATMPALLSI
jgi:hypothetical protein